MDKKPNELTLDANQEKIRKDLFSPEKLKTIFSEGSPKRDELTSTAQKEAKSSPAISESSSIQASSLKK